MAHQLNHHATPLLASARSNGAWPLHAKNAATIPCKISKQRIPRPIVCSIDGAGLGTNVAVEKATNGPVEKAPEDVPAIRVLGRSSFPPGFVFGAASAAYQIEGAWNEGGKGQSIWDTFTHQQPSKIKDKSNGDVATDAYHRYKDDIKIMKQMGVDSYRFSISWPRILPDGTLQGGVNQDGVDYYNNLIDELIKNGIKPFVTIFHWDVPQALEDKYGGFRDRRIVDDFRDYAKVCFQRFGDRVKHWITVNEPWTFSSMGYSLGQHAPGRCSETLGCLVGDSLTEPYIVTHNLILAHRAAARLYKDYFKVLQRGEIGITLNSTWYEPYSKSYDDVQAADRAMDFMLGWFMDPLVNGDYPFIMRALVRDRLPYFTEEETDMIKGSYDFIGLNYYTANYARSHPMSATYTPPFSIYDSYADRYVDKHGIPIGKLEGTWIYVVPIGMKDLLVYTKTRYNHPKIYITENGTAQLDEHNLPLERALADKDRIEYMSLHLAQVRAAIQEGVNVKGYFAWAMTDNFEWSEGYTQRFGLTYIDFANDQKRHPKLSTKWYARFLESPLFPILPIVE